MSGKGFVFHKFAVRNSGTSSGDVRKLCVQRARWGYDIYIYIYIERERDWTQGQCADLCYPNSDILPQLYRNKSISTESCSGIPPSVIKQLQKSCVRSSLPLLTPLSLRVPWRDISVAPFREFGWLWDIEASKQVDTEYVDNIKTFPSTGCGYGNL